MGLSEVLKSKKRENVRVCYRLYILQGFRGQREEGVRVLESHESKIFILRVNCDGI